MWLFVFKIQMFQIFVLCFIITVFFLFLFLFFFFFGCCFLFLFLFLFVFPLFFFFFFLLLLLFLFLCGCLFSRYKCFRFLFFVFNNRPLLLYSYCQDFVSICLLRYSGLYVNDINTLLSGSPSTSLTQIQIAAPHPVSLPIIQICYNQKKFKISL